MAGTCLTDQSGLSEFNGLDSVDILARLIYSIKSKDLVVLAFYCELLQN
jgi:hypothetical protein